VGLGIAPAPDETTVLRFRHLLEEHGVGGLMLETGNIDLEVKGIRSRRARSWMRYPRAFVDQERKRRARSGDAPDQEGQPVVLRFEGAPRRRCEARHGAYGGHDPGQRGGLAHAARSAARGKTQGMGRWWVPGPDRGDPASRSKGSGHDLPQNEVQELCGRVTKEEEPN